MYLNSCVEIIILLVSYALALAMKRNVFRIFGGVVVFFCLFFFLFFFPSTASSAVPAVKILRTTVAAHVQHQNVCLVVSRHACSGCASLFCLVKVSTCMSGCNLSLPLGSGDIINISNLCFGHARIVYSDS